MNPAAWVTDVDELRRNVVRAREDGSHGDRRAEPAPSMPRALVRVRLPSAPDFRRTRRRQEHRAVGHFDLCFVEDGRSAHRRRQIRFDRNELALKERQSRDPQSRGIRTLGVEHERRSRACAAEREVDALSDLKHIGVRKILNAAVVARQKDLHARDGLDRHAGLVRQCEDRRRRTHRPLEPIGPRDVENEGVVVAERRERRLQRGGIVVSVRENPQRRGRLHGAHDLRGGRRRAEEAAERQPRRVRENSRPTA
jgi:hypothetical protein